MMKVLKACGNYACICVLTYGKEENRVSKWLN